MLSLPFFQITKTDYHDVADTDIQIFTFDNNWKQKGVKTLKCETPLSNKKCFDIWSASQQAWTSEQLDAHNSYQIGAVNKKDAVRFYMTRKTDYVNSSWAELTSWMLS